jgi:hypothetical protein
LHEHGWGIWGQQDDVSLGDFSLFTCGLSPPGLAHPPHELNEWNDSFAVVQRLEEGPLRRIVERSEGNHPWKAFTVAVERLQAAGAGGASLAVDKALLKCLALPKGTKWSQVKKLGNGPLWEAEASNADAVDEATAMMRELCEVGSLFRMTFNDEFVTYPVFVAGRLKKNSALLVAYSERVET